MQDKYYLKVRHEDGLKAALHWYLTRATWTDNGGHSIKGVTFSDIGVRQTLNASIEAGIDIPDHLKQRIVGEGLAEWYRSSREPLDIQAFERALREASRSLEDRSQPLTVVTLWNVRTPADAAVTFTVNDLSTSIGWWPEGQEFGLEEVWKRAVDFWYSGAPRWLYEDEGHWIPVNALTTGVTEILAPDWLTAVEIVSHSHELIRGALNRPRALRLGIRWSRLPTPLGDVLASPVWAVFAKDRKLLDVAYGLEVLHDVGRADLTDGEVTEAQTLLRQLDDAAPDREIARFKRKLLRLYQAALDSTDRQSQFLSFWQVVEAATVTEPGSRDRVESRLATLLGLEAGSINSHLAQAMAALRHDLVHRGTYPVDDSELPFVLKWIADHALARAFALIDALGGVNEMHDYFKYATHGTTTLERLTKVAAHILTYGKHRPVSKSS